MEPDRGLVNLTCDECGALLPASRIELHRRWHEDLDDRLNPREGV